MRSTAQLPLRITFRDIPHSEAVESSVRRHAEKLLTFSGRIIACNVAIEAPHRHHRHGNRYRVRIDLAVAGAELVADRTSAPDAQHDLYAVIDDAFDHAARLLREHAERRSARASAG